MSFNLIDERWIPCVPVGGGPVVERSIAEVLIDASDYREVYDNSPLVTVSLHRLLLAILYRALRPTESSWKEMWHEGRFPREALQQYFADVEPCFDLFSETNPFSQVPCARDGNGSSPLSVLFVERASNTNRTLFDHTSNDACTRELPSTVARDLVAYQSYALGGGNSSSVVIGGSRYPPAKRNYTHGVLQRGAAVLVCGDTLYETLMLNLIPYDAAEANLPSSAAETDGAAWELGVLDRYDESRPHGYADRYTWQVRLVTLREEGDAVSPSIVVTQGLVMEDEEKLPFHLRDPMFHHRVSKDKTRVSPWDLDHNRASWRDLHALLATHPESRGGNRPPLSLCFLASIAEEAGTGLDGREFGMHVFGTASNQAKVSCWRHDRLPAPAALLRDAGLVERLGSLLHGAEITGGQLNTQSRILCANYLIPGFDALDESKQSEALRPNPKRPTDIDQLSNEIDPRRDYWAKLEGHFYALLRELPVDKEAASERWYANVTREAHAAFNASAGQLGQSARAIRARAKVGPHFDPRPSTSSKTDKREEVTV